MNIQDDMPKAAISRMISEHQVDLARMRVDPTWHVFEQTFDWFLIRGKTTPETQDLIHETWLVEYAKQKNALKKTCR